MTGEYSEKYKLGTLGHLVEFYLEPYLYTTLIIYERGQNEEPPKLMYEDYLRDRRVYEFLRPLQVTDMYDAEGGGLVVIVKKEEEHGQPNN